MSHPEGVAADVRRLISILDCGLRISQSEPPDVGCYADSRPVGKLSRIYAIKMESAGVAPILFGIAPA